MKPHLTLYHWELPQALAERGGWTNREIVGWFGEFVEIISKKGTTVGFINEEEVFGEQSILLDIKRTVTAKAVKDCLAIKIPKNTLISEYRKSSSLIRAILRSTCIRLTNLDNSIHTSLKSEDD